uniref:Uncharacterized protein n=1 Tax=Romanomermis culicivorax TaxID=13658 RepID=A0A915IWR3_ROMCU
MIKIIKSANIIRRKAEIAGFPQRAQASKMTKKSLIRGLSEGLYCLCCALLGMYRRNTRGVDLFASTRLTDHNIRSHNLQITH